MSGEVDLAAAAGRNAEGGSMAEEEGLKTSSESPGSHALLCSLRLLSKDYLKGNYNKPSEDRCCIEILYSDDPINSEAGQIPVCARVDISSQNL